MDFKFPLKNHQPRDLIRRCGYGEWRGDAEHETSYTRKLGSNNYPHFHIYLKVFSKYFEVSLHLDQKRPSYLPGRAHSGEYDGEVVENEAKRITAVIKDIYDNEVC